MTLTDSQLRTLRHMLGIDNPRLAEPVPYRDYYCADKGNVELHELERVGAVRLVDDRLGYEWFVTTDAGREAAIASHATIRYPRERRVYLRWLSISDTMPGLSFHDFLTLPEWNDDRRKA
jgi:hypothetical protein